MLWLLVSAQISAASTQGCIDQPFDACLAQLRTSLRLDEDQISQQLAHASETDVNGKPLGGIKTISTSAYFGDSSSPDILTITRDGEGKVESVELSLRSTPELARTAQEYADTGLGVAFRAVLPNSCTAAEGDIGTFKFFENVVKPTLKIGDKDTTIDETHASTDRMTESSAVPYCGVAVRYTNLRGYDTDDISESNEHGAYSFSMIAFSRPEPGRMEPRARRSRYVRNGTANK